MAGDAFLDFARAQAVAGHVDHVVRTAQNKVIAVRIAHAPVKRGIHLPAAEGGPVGIDEARIVAIHGLHAARRQRAFQHQHALLVGGALLARRFVEQLDLVAVHGQARAAQARRRVGHAFRHG
ncbi:hypothetical protein D3C72_1613950 [compost metagenome]